ncbi:MAG TPA: MFS transporter [Actinocrinis sp.]|uniref:MFS transporter n=1 Tax=Actinocrinis sp. TaxID=1920516 RepID=UPI002DDC95CD|nr:MFS transporter [Actinocrinis sp.]HEV2344904.1 MFS transporter [Actinocrinis sp.]
MSVPTSKAADPDYNAARSGHWLLRAEPRFTRLLAAVAVSGIGDWFSTVAVLGLVLSLTGSGLAVGITLTVRILTYLTVSPLAGALADRISRKAILVAADLARTLSALAYLLVSGHGGIWIVYAGTFALEAFTALSLPAQRASIPALVRPGNLLRANALDQAVLGLVMVVGTVLGGVVLAALGARAAFIANSATFLISALIIATIRYPATARSVDDAEPAARLRPVIRRSPQLRIVAAMFALWPLGGGIINILIPVYGFTVFGDGRTGIAVLYGAQGVGFLVGGGVARRVGERTAVAAALGFVVDGACHVFVSQAPDLAAGALFMMIGTVGAGVGNACAVTLAVQAAPATVHGRLFGTLDALSNSVLGVSMLLGGVLTQVMAPRPLGLAAGCALTINALLFGGLLVRAGPRHAIAVVREAEETG